jgi:hypothetical protein
MRMSTDAKVRATARVRLTLEFPVGDTWGDDCTAAQIQQQAKESALQVLREGFREANGGANRSALSLLLDKGIARIVGEPHITAVLVEEADRG